jgi:hypothetical protein
LKRRRRWRRNGDTLAVQFLPWPRAYQMAENHARAADFLLAARCNAKRATADRPHRQR